MAPGEATVKIVLTRGPATRGYALPAMPHPTRIVAAFDPPTVELLAAVQAMHERWNRRGTEWNLAMIVWFGLVGSIAMAGSF